MQFLSQNDAFWKLKRINGTTSTIGSWGCLITDVCWILNQAGYQITPDVLATKSELFQANSALWIGWDKLEALFPKIKYAWGERCESTPAPIDKIIREVDNGYYPIIMLDYAPKVTGIQTHYLTVISHDDKGNLQVGDPIDGTIVWLDTRYGELDEKYKILKVDVFHHQKVEMTPDLWERIKSFLTVENSFTEGDIREGMALFQSKASRESDMKSLQETIANKQQKLLEKDIIIGELTNQIKAKDQALKHHQDFINLIASTLGRDIAPTEAAVVEAVSTLIGVEDKNTALYKQIQSMNETKAASIADEVKKQTFDIQVKLLNTQKEVEKLTKELNKYITPPQPKVSLTVRLSSWLSKLFNK